MSGGGSRYGRPVAASFVCKLISRAPTYSAEPGCSDCSRRVAATNLSSGGEVWSPDFRAADGAAQTIRCAGAREHGYTRNCRL